jgi:class 3 adenylate cyclase
MAGVILSPGVELAWQVAGDLALSYQDEFIESKHLLYGICALEKVIDDSKTSLKNPGDELRVRADVKRLQQLVADHGTSLGMLRRTIRQALSSGGGLSKEAQPPRVIGRSKNTKDVFDRAEQIARNAGLEELGVITLLQALLEVSDPQLERIIDPLQLEVDEVLSELRRATDRPAALNISLNPELRNLDDVADLRRIEIGETVDASLSIPLRSASLSKDKSTPVRPEPSRLSSIESFAYLSEFTWEFGTHGGLEPMLSKAAERLLHSVSNSERCAILVRDSSSSELLLKAHSPANATPRISMTSVRRAMAEKKGFIWSRGEELSLSQKESKIETGMYVPLVINGEAIGVVCLDSAAQSKDFLRDDLLLVTSFAHQIALAVANHELALTLKQNSEVLERLMTNFSPKVRTRLLQRARMGRLKLGGEQSVVSILCCDIRGFTRLTAGMCAEDVVTLLNEYFAVLTDCIFRNDGTIDKFVGDAILAVFGSPEADPAHYRNAVVAGMEMQQSMESVSARRQARGDAVCQIGIGIHMGEVLHGFIGSQERMEFTVIGEPVNRASRYCDGAKAAEILISPEIHERVWKLVSAEPVSIPTKHEGDLQAYRVTRIRRADAEPK